MFSFIIPFISVRFPSLRYVLVRTIPNFCGRYGAKLCCDCDYGRHPQTVCGNETKSYNLKLMGLKNTDSLIFFCLYL
jgi:hypothetical protein